jgi:hypothetical protein
VTVRLAPRQARLASFSEASRRFVVRYVFFLYFLSLVEGPLRKWILPEFATPLIFLRDPFVLLLYGYCALAGLRSSVGVAPAWYAAMAVSAALGALQYVYYNYPAWAFPLGFRAYWLYVPLGFIIASTFHRDDVLRFLRLTCWIALPYAVLVAFQYNAGPSSILNLGVGSDDQASLSLGGSIVRPFGLFSFSSPNLTYTLFSVCAFFALAFAAPREKPPAWMYYAMGAAVAAMSVLTGSRSIYFLAAGIIFLCVVGIAAAGPRAVMGPKSTSFGGIWGIAALVAIAAITITRVFPDMMEAMVFRFDEARNAEGNELNRIEWQFLSFLDAATDAPLFGYGLGAGASGVSGALRLPPFVFGEPDLTRNINELGIFFGPMFLLLRWVTAIWLMHSAIRLARLGAASALPLAALASIAIAGTEITNSPILSFFIWLLFGLSLAIGNGWRTKTGRTTAARKITRQLP